MIRVHLTNGEMVEVDNVNISQLIEAINTNTSKIERIQFLTINKEYLFLWDNISYIEGVNHEDNKKY